MDWFLYDRDLRHERLKENVHKDIHMNNEHGYHINILFTFNLVFFSTEVFILVLVSLMLTFNNWFYIFLADFEHGFTFSLKETINLNINAF